MQMLGEPDEDDLELVRTGPLPWPAWLELTGRDAAAFGATSAGLVYRDKEHHVVLRSSDGRYAGALGLTVVTVSVEGGEAFQVVGMGSMIVRHDLRGRGLSARLSAGARGLAAELGPDRAMLFSEPGLAALHRGRGYVPIDAPVFVDQPGERIRMPLPAMWRPIRPCEWRNGRVDVHGLPF
jgi:GNAT superfamily N-acetyltransferase